MKAEVKIPKGWKKISSADVKPGDYVMTSFPPRWLRIVNFLGTPSGALIIRRTNPKTNAKRKAKP